MRGRVEVAEREILREVRELDGERECCAVFSTSRDSLLAWHLQDEEE